MRSTLPQPLALLLALTGLPGCPKGNPGENDAASAKPSSSTQVKMAPSASAAPLPLGAKARACRLGAPQLVTEGRGGITHAIAANGDAVLVTWGEKRKPGPNGGSFPEDATQRFEMARLFDAKTLAPRGAATVLGSQEAVDAFSNGAAPFAAADGSLRSATCAWVAFAGKLSCTFADVAKATAPAKRVNESVPGPGPDGERIAAVDMGDHALVLLPQCGDLRLVSSTATKMPPLFRDPKGGLDECEPKGKVDVPALGRAGDTAFAVARRGGVLIGRTIVRAQPQGPVVQLSDRGVDVGAPAVVSNGSRASVYYASRSGKAPFALTVTHWADGGALTRATLATGAAPAVAPAVAASGDAACVVLSWTEGSGKETRVRAGLACNDALVASTAVDVSPKDVEAGDSELAAAFGKHFVVWQELPKGRPPELKLAALSCD